MAKDKFRVNADIGGVKKGSIISIEVDSAGVPHDSFWRRRVRDAAIDNCIERVKPAPKPTTKKDDE